MSDIQTSRRALLGGGLGSALVVLGVSEAKASGPASESRVQEEPSPAIDDGQLPTLARSVPHELWPG